MQDAGDGWQKFANLRCYFAFMWTMSGKKLLFMGCEFGQGDEWNHNKSLDWHLLDSLSRGSGPGARPEPSLPVAAGTLRDRQRR